MLSPITDSDVELKRRRKVSFTQRIVRSVLRMIRMWEEKLSSEDSGFTSAI
jgi:hypothetical protein